jgi:hypothetical protein
LDAYWEWKRTYKDEHPLMIKYYFPDYEAGAVAAMGGARWTPRRYPRRRRRGAGRAAPTPGGDWQRFVDLAGPEIVDVLIGYWSGQPLSAEATAYLQSLFERNPYGAASFEEWLELLRSMWAQTQGAPPWGYEIPMRERGTFIRPVGTEGGQRTRWPTPPTRVRYLRSY